MSDKRFSLYEALYVFCKDFHRGQWSRGYRILGRLRQAGFYPSLSVQYGKLDDEAAAIYWTLVERYKDKI